MEDMYKRFTRLAARPKKEEEPEKEEKINKVLEETPLEHRAPKRPPFIEPIEWEKLKKSYDTWVDKTKTDTSDERLTDPRFVQKEQEGELGDVARSLNIDAIVDLDASTRAMLEEYADVVDSWKDLYKKWHTESKKIVETYDKLEEKAVELFMSLVENVKATDQNVRIPSKTKMDYQDALARIPGVESAWEELEGIREKAMEIHKKLMKEIESTTGYIMDGFESTGLTSRRVIKILLAVHKITPADAAKIHLAALNAVFARMESRSEQAKNEISTLKKEIEKTKAAMLKKFAHDAEIGLHLYEGDAKVLSDVADKFLSPEMLNKLHTELQNRQDKPSAPRHPGKAPESTPSGVEQAKSEMIERPVEKSETSDASSTEADDMSQALFEKIRKNRKASSLRREAMGMGITELITGIGERARNLSRLLNSLDSYCDAAIHQLEAKGVEVEDKEIEKLEDEEGAEMMMHAPVPVAAEKSKEGITKKSA